MFLIGSLLASLSEYCAGDGSLLVSLSILMAVCTVLDIMVLGLLFCVVFDDWISLVLRLLEFVGESPIFGIRDINRG
jgi:hypothetical protein